MGKLVIKYHREYKNLPIAKVKHEFVSNCFLSNWYMLKPGLTQAESVKRMNNFMHEELRYYFEMRCRGEEGWQALKELTSHPDESARLRAAVYYRYRDPDYAIPVIEEMGRNRDFWAPRTVKRLVAFQAFSIARDLKRQQAGKMKPYPNIYESWLKTLEVEGKGKSPKVKYVEAVIPYNREYSALSLEQIRVKFLEHSHLIQSVKIDEAVTLAKELKSSKEAECELYRLYFELRERGDEGLSLLREIASSGALPARIQAGKLLQWQDTKFACDALTEISDSMEDYEQGTIEYETCSDALSECVVFGPVLENTSYGTVDPYDQWKETQAAKK